MTSPAVNHSSLPPFLEPVGRCGQFRGRIREILPITRTDYTISCHVDVVRSIEDDAGKMDATLMPGGRCFGFRYSLLQRGNARMGLPTLPSCYIVVSFLLLDVSVFCKPINASEATRH